MDQATLRKLVILAVVGLAAGAAIALAIRDAGRNSSPATVQSSGEALIGGPFTLTDHTGKRVSEKDFEGRYMLVFFGFTHCPDICPASLQVLSTALQKLDPAKVENLTPVFITVDPERDTVETMAAYVKSFHPSLVGLTGSKDDIAATIKTFRVYAQKIDDKNTPGHFSYDHSTLFYLMGKDGKFVAPIPHTTNPDELRNAIDSAMG